MSNGSNSGEKRGDTSKGNNRRRYFRRRKSAPKAQEPAAKPEPRKVQEAAPKLRTRNNAKAEIAGKSDRDRRGGRRRRRRSRSERVEETPVVSESILAAIEHEYTPPKSVFVYTYVLRPGAPSAHEFRPEHFSRVGRRLEDFEIDLSPIFPEEGTARKATKPILTEPMDEDESSAFPDEFTDE